MTRNNNMWRIAKPGIIKFVETAPAMKVAKKLPIVIKLKKQIKKTKKTNKKIDIN